MTPQTTDVPSEVLITPKAALQAGSHTLRAFSKAVDLHWADSSEGAPVLDGVPNPKQFLVGSVSGFKLAMDFGPPGVGIRPPA